MKKYGVIIEYDGYCGTIISIEGIEYVTLKKDFLYENINRGDIVTFISEKISNITETNDIARFIKKVEN